MVERRYLMRPLRGPHRFKASSKGPMWCVRCPHRKTHPIHLLNSATDARGPAADSGQPGGHRINVRTYVPPDGEDE